MVLIWDRLLLSMVAFLIQLNTFNIYVILFISILGCAYCITKMHYCCCVWYNIHLIVSRETMSQRKSTSRAVPHKIVSPAHSSWFEGFEELISSLKIFAVLDTSFFMISSDFFLDRNGLMKCYLFFFWSW